MSSFGSPGSPRSPGAPQSGIGGSHCRVLSGKFESNLHPVHTRNIFSSIWLQKFGFSNANSMLQHYVISFLKFISLCQEIECFSHLFKGRDMNNGLNIVQEILCHPQDFLNIGEELNLLKVCIDKMVNLCHLVSYFTFNKGRRSFIYQHRGTLRP